MASEAMAGVARCQQLRDLDLARAPAQLAEAGDRLAMAGNDDNGFAALDLVEDPRQMGLRLRRLDLAHIWAVRQVKMTWSYVYEENRGSIGASDRACARPDRPGGAAKGPSFSDQHRRGKIAMIA